MRNRRGAGPLEAEDASSSSRGDPVGRARSLRQHLIIAGLGVLVPILLAGGLAFYLVEKTSSNFQDAAAESRLEALQRGELLRELEAFDRSAEVALATGSPPDADLRRIHEELLDELAVAAGFSHADEQSAALLAARQVDSAWGTLNELPAGSPGELTSLRGNYERSISGVDALVLELIQLGASELDSELAAVEAEERRDRLPLYAGLIIGLLIAVGAIRGLSRQVARPLRRLRDAADQLRRGELTHRAVPEGPEETRMVAVAFNEMAASIDRGHRELEKRAARDPLTGLVNRRSLEAIFARVSALSKTTSSRRCSSSIWTTSSRSTTRGDMPSATRSSGMSGRGSRDRFARG